jgi:Helix-turn-helix
MDMRRLVGENVRRIRQKKGLTQEHLADISGFSQQYISGLERGRRNPGSKSGPAVKPSGETTGSDMSDHNRAVRQQDSSKIPGQPGNKSGPSVRPPSEAK